jgi:diaminopimelate decarboxylase
MIRLLSTIPTHIGIAVQFHFAASTIGGCHWFDCLADLSSFTYKVSNLVQRRISILDFGGGWNPYLFDSPDSVNRLNTVLQHFTSLFADQLGGPPCIQIEAGKCISEPAGAVVSRILAIRETVGGGRAIILDTCIAQTSSPHLHPIYYLPSNATDKPWTLLAAGDDALWGRTCMEFDRIYTPVCVPIDAAPGDFVLICSAGAYDSSMQYDFGDGIQRDITIL